MKTYRHLWEDFISDDNIRLAVRNASKGKRDRHHVKLVYDNMDKYIPVIRQYTEDFKPPAHKPKMIYDGISRKKREIIVPTFMEQIIHHMAVNVLKPIFMRGMYFHSYGSIPNRGSHKGKRYIEKFIRRNPKKCKYFLKMDIKKFFPSVDLAIVKRKLARIIKDDRFLDLMCRIIDTVPRGLPLGFYTSQWLANWFLQDLDHYIKEKLHAIFYIRYMDDIVIFDGSKRKLHKMREAIEEYLHTINLDMKGNWQVALFDNSFKQGRALDFMGFRFYRDRTTLRKSILYKATRKARRMSKKPKKTVHDSRALLSYLGFFKCTDTYTAYRIWIKPFTNVRLAKKRVSNYDRRTQCSTNQKILMV